MARSFSAAGGARSWIKLLRRMLALLLYRSSAAAVTVADSCLPGDEWSKSPPGQTNTAQHIKRTMVGHRLRVVAEEGLFRTVPASVTEPVPRGEMPCALTAHATRSDGRAARAGEVAVAIHQVALGMRFSSDLALGDVVPLEPGGSGTTYSFSAAPGFQDVVLAKMPLRADESDEFYEQLKKPKDEV